MPEEKLGTAVLDLATDDKRLEKGLEVAKGKADRFGVLSKAAFLGAAGGAIAVGAALLKIGSDFDEAFDTIRVGTGATGEALEGLKGDFKAVFSAVPTDMKTASTAIADLNTRLGLTGKPLQALSAQMINLSRVTGTEVGPLIASTTRVFGDWSVATEKQGSTLDFLFKTSQATGIGVDELANKVVQFGAPLRAMGFSLEESAALLGKWEKEGVNSELVLGSLRIAMGKFAKDGVPMREGLDDTIKKIQTLGPGAEATSLAMEVFGARAGPDMAAAILEGRFEMGELIKSLEASGETINGVAGETDDWTQKLEVMKNKLLIAVAPAADAVFGALGQLIEFVTPLLVSLVEWIGTWLPGAMQEAGVILKELSPLFVFLGEVLGALATVALPVLKVAFEILGTGIRGFIEVVKTLVGWLRSAWEMLQNVASAIRDSPIGGAIGAAGNILGGIGGAARRVGIPGFAHGGSFIARSPTLALFGEGSRDELVTAAPLGGSPGHEHPIVIELDGHVFARVMGERTYGNARARGLEI